MTLCLLPNLQGYKRLGEPNAAVEYDPMDLPDFIIKHFGPINATMGCAGIRLMVQKSSSPHPAHLAPSFAAR